MYNSEQNCVDSLKNADSINLVYGNKSKNMPWLDLVCCSEMFCNMKMGSQDNSKKLTIPDVCEDEFEEFLQFLSLPDNINIKLTMKNVSYITKLADRFICNALLKKCEELLLTEAKQPWMNTNLNRSIILNLSSKYFPKLMKEPAITNFTISKIDLGAIENLELIREKIVKYVSNVREVNTNWKLNVPHIPHNNFFNTPKNDGYFCVSEDVVLSQIKEHKERINSL